VAVEMKNILIMRHPAREDSYSYVKQVWLLKKCFEFRAAPEMLTGRDNTNAVDIWATGILSMELVTI